MNSSNGALDFEAYINTDQFKKDAAEMERRVKGITTTVDSESNKMAQLFSGIAKGAVAALSFDAAMNFRSKLIEVRGEFQKYEAVLTNSLGSQSLAAESMQMLSEIASETPFQLDRLTGAYVKLVNQGFKPTREEVIKLGDLASSTGKDFNQLAEAVLDAQTGEFERLKEFGIKAKNQGDTIAFSFKGVQTTVENSSESIRNFVLSLGDMQGVKGSMEAISQTLVGQVSNLEDAIINMFNEMGKSSEGFLSGSIAATKLLVDNYALIGKIIGTLIVTYGAYKAAVITLTAVEKARNAVMVYDIVTKKAVVTMDGILAVATNKLTAAQARLNATMLANPYVLVATAIVGLVALTWALSDSTTAAEKAQAEYNERKDAAIAKEAAFRAETEKNITTARDSAASTIERIDALEKLKSAYPGIFDKYDIESIKLADLVGLQKSYNEEIAKRSKIGNQVQSIMQDNEVKRIEALIKAEEGKSSLLNPNKATNLVILRAELEKARVLNSKYNKDVQTDRVNSYIQGIQAQSDAQIEAELKARKEAAAKLKNAPEGFEITISGGMAGSFDKKELESQIKLLELEQSKRKEVTYTSIELENKYTKALSDAKKEREAINNKELSETDRLKQLKDVDAKIKAAEEKLSTLRGKSEKTKTVEAVNFDYTDTIAKSYEEATKIIETETEKWTKAITQAVDSELEEMVKTADADAEAAQKKADLQAETIEKTQTLSEKLNKIKAKYAEEEAALIDSNAAFLPEKLAELKKIKAAEIATVVESASQVMEMGKLELIDFLANTQAKIKAMQEQGKNVEALQAQYDAAVNALQKMPSEDPFIRLVESIKDYDKTADSVSNKDTLQKIFEYAAIAAKELQGDVEGVVSILQSLGAINSDQAENINKTTEQLVGIAEGANNIASGIMNKNPLQVVKGIIQVIDNGIKLLDVKTKKIEKSQQAITGEIEKMDAAYKKLDASIKNSLGTDTYKTQLEMYKLNAREMIKYDQLIALERSKKKKKQNQDDINSWNEAKENLKNDNTEILASITESLAQTNAKDLATELADSITGAFAAGEDAALAWGEVTEQVMANAVKNALKLQLLEKPMNDAVNQLASDMEDGVLSESEQKAFRARIDNASKDYYAALEMYSDIFDTANTVSADPGKALTGAIKGVTEDTASVIAGQMNAIRMNQADNNEILRKSLLHLANIDINTYTLHSIKVSIENIDRKTSSTTNTGVL